MSNPPSRSVEPSEQMLLLNLLGGRLPLGHRMAGEAPGEVARRVSERLDRVLRRMRRVADLVEQLDA